MTNTVNIFTWERNRVPFGISQTPEGKWSYGMLPYALREQVLNQLRANSRERVIARVSRDDEPEADGKRITPLDDAFRRMQLYAIIRSTWAGGDKRCATYLREP